MMHQNTFFQNCSASGHAVCSSVFVIFVRWIMWIPADVVWNGWPIVLVKVLLKWLLSYWQWQLVRLACTTMTSSENISGREDLKWKKRPINPWSGSLVRRLKQEYFDCASYFWWYSWRLKQIISVFDSVFDSFFDVIKTGKKAAEYLYGIVFNSDWILKGTSGSVTWELLR